MDFYEIAKKIDNFLESSVTAEGGDELLALIQEDTSYQDYFFKKVNDIQWFSAIKKAGYFNPDKNPRPVPAEREGSFMIPTWIILPYLERVSKQVSAPSNAKYIDELLSIINEVSNYKDTKGQRVDNYRTWWYFVKILLNIPSEKIPIEIIELIPIWVDSQDSMLQGSDIATKLLPKFLDNHPSQQDIQKAEKIIDSITAIKTVPLNEERAKLLGKKEENRLVIDPYWLQKVFGDYSEIIGKKCTARVIEDLISKIKSLLKKDSDGTYESFYEESEHPIPEDEPLEMLTFILKRILLAKAKSDVNTTEKILRNFLEEQYLFFPKMAIYIMGQDIDNYSELFWEILDTEIGVDIMENTFLKYIGDELKYLLRNLKQLSDEQRKNLNIKIEQAIKRHPFKEDPEKYSALYKQRIYHALSHDTYFKNLYEEMKKKTNVDTELHPAVGKVEVHWGEGPSVLTKEEILRMLNKELAEFLSTFKAKDFWEGPTVGGLSDMLKVAAQEQPDKFINDLSPFLNTGYIYIYDILRGTKDAFNEKKGIDWGKIFEFIELYIKRKEFWEDKFIVKKGDFHGEANHLWVIGAIGELIQDGTKDDAWAFSEEYFDKVKEIIFLLLKEPKEDEEITDYVTYTINTSCGKLITALIYLALRIARVNDKKGVKNDLRWSEDYRSKFDELLDKEIIEAYTSFGLFLPNLAYLDKKWVKVKIKMLTSDMGSKYWVAFIEGYLSIGKVYEDFYKLMKPHYHYGLTYEFKEGRNRRHLVQHICIGYLRNHESFDDPNSLFRELIDAWEPDQIIEVIGFFSMQRKHIMENPEQNEEMKGRIIEFWRQLYKRYKDENRLTQEDKKILSYVSKLAVFLDQIDSESFEWLMLSALYVQEDFNSPYFIECLDELKEKGNRKETVKYIGEIYLKMLEKITPDFDQKHIRSIIEFLYNAGAQENANKICNIYGSRGLDFLRDIYEKFKGTEQDVVTTIQ